MRVHALLALAVVSLFFSCRKNDTPPDTEKRSPRNGVTMHFNHYVGNEKLRISTAVHKNQNGDDLMITKIIYLISNVKLQNVDGTEYALPGVYRVSETDEESLSIEMENIPDGTYRSVSFMIGVDSNANKYALASGQLNESDEMFLNDKDGYIMVNLEGISPSSPQPEHAVKFHIGGATGYNNVVTPVSLDFPVDIVVNGDFRHIRMRTDLQKMFGPAFLVNFATLSSISAPGDNARLMSLNYKNMISIISVGE